MRTELAEQAKLPVLKSDQGSLDPLQKTSRIKLLWTVVVGLGLASFVIGWINLLWLWHPLGLGVTEWEMETIRAHFDGMSMASMGLGAVAVGAIGRGSRGLVRIVAIVSSLVAVGSFAVFAIFALNVPVVLHEMGLDGRPEFWKATIRTSLISITYISLYAWLAAYLWTRTKLQ